MKLSTLVQMARIPPAMKRRSVTEPGSPVPSNLNGSAPSSPTKGKGRASVTEPQPNPSIISSQSGGSPITHESLLDVADDNAIERIARLVHDDEFILDPAGGVHAPRLLNITRRELFTKARMVGANALVDEEWTVTICKPKRRGAKTRVNVHYTAIAARCKGTDPQVPVAAQEAQSVPGLMTVLERV